MANIKSQIKRNRQNERNRERNVAVRSGIKTATKKAEDSGADDDIRTAQSALDAAASKGRIHKKQAARRTSRLMKRAAGRS